MRHPLRTYGQVPDMIADERCAATLLRAFFERGVRAAFGIPGGAAGPVFDALADIPQIEYVPTRHEAIAGFAALGHARRTGTPALLLTTAGPGVTNAVTAMASALLEETPLIMIGGEVPVSSTGRAGFQEGSAAGLDVVALMRSVTRWSATVWGASMAAGAAQRAFDMATGQRPGPVFLSVPFDVAQARGPSTPIAPASPSRLRPDARACAQAARTLASAKRPLLVLGNGARHAFEEARQLAEALAAPVAVTGHAKGTFPESHPLYLGIIGNAGHPSANEYIGSGPDVVCIVGSRVGDFATNGWRLDLSGRVATIQIDREAWLIGRNARVTQGIVGEAASTLSAITAALPPHRTRSVTPRGLLRRVEFDEEAPPGLIKPHVALGALARAFPEAIWCSDIGEHMGFAQHYLVIDSPDRFHCMSGLASMGSGLGAAMGIKQADPRAPVIALIGDGGFNMHAGEVLTCVELGLALIIAIFNDGRWNMVEHGFKSVFQREPDFLRPHTADLAAVARGYGAIAEVIDDQEQLDPKRLRHLVAGDRPVVLDVRIDASAALSTRSRSAGLRSLATKAAAG
jgi:acetolactate synthase I/II/III large subunit